MKAFVSFETSGNNYQALWLRIPEDESSTTPSWKRQDRSNNVASFSVFVAVQLRYPLFADREPRLWLMFLRQLIGFIIRGRNVHGIDISAAEDEITRCLETLGCNTTLKKRNFRSYFACLLIMLVGPVAQSVSRLTTGWTVRDRMPVGTRFSARPDRPWDPPSLLYNGYWGFPRGKVRPGRAADHSPPSSAAVMEQ